MISFGSYYFKGSLRASFKSTKIVSHVKHKSYLCKENELITLSKLYVTDMPSLWKKQT